MSLDRDLRVLGAAAIGPGIGEIYYLVTNKTTDKYYALLQKRRVNESRIGTVLNDVYTAMSDAQNDTVFVFPGVHTTSADLTWAKSHTHLYGVGGPLQEGDTYVDCTLITSGMAGTSSLKTLYITGAQNQFHNVMIEQGQAAATAVTAVMVKGPSNYFKNVAMAGLMSSTQDTGTTLSSLEVGSSASYCYFENCTIGTPLWDENSAINGQILFSNSSASTVPQDITFKGCRILNQSATATNPAVRLTSNYAVDRLLEFRDCTFYNFQTNLGSVLTSGVFLDGCGTTHMILLSGSTCHYGWSNWADVHTYIYSSAHAGSNVSGIAVNTT